MRCKPPVGSAACREEGALRKEKAVVPTGMAASAHINTQTLTLMAYMKYRSERLYTERRKMRSTDFGIPETREFPMPDGPHVRAAESYFRYAPDDKKPLLAHRILIKARKYGVRIHSAEILEWAANYKKNNANENE